MRSTITLPNTAATRFIHKLSVDPVWQFHFHGVMSTAWLATMFLVPFISAFSLQRDLVGLAIMEVSLWANFATHFGAMSAALAAILTNNNTASASEVSQHIDV